MFNKFLSFKKDSAYLIKNVNEDLKTIDNEKSIRDFDNLLELHNIEIERL